MIDPADNGVTLPLPVTAECPHSLRYASPQGILAIVLQQDLLGDWLILQSWGQRMRPVANLEDGLAMLEKIGRRLEKQGCEQLGVPPYSIGQGAMPAGS